MRRGVYQIMELNEIKQRLELALRPAKPPTLEEVLEQVSTHGVLRGPVDWVFPAWATYVDYATRRITETFRLSEEERGTLLNFRDTMKRLLLETWMQAKEKLTTLYKAVAEGTYKLEGKRLYAQSDWMYVGRTFYIHINGISVSTRFPDMLKLPEEKIELLQIGWRASDETEAKMRPSMSTSQPWQVFAWAVVRNGALYIRVDTVNLTREGVSVVIRMIARSWRQRWNKDEAITLVINHFKHGEWTPLFTMWLGDGEANNNATLRGKYVVIASKEPKKIGKPIGRYEAVIASGTEAFAKLRDVAGVYGTLLDALKSHKWNYIKMLADPNKKTRNNGTKAEPDIKPVSIEKIDEKMRQHKTTTKPEPKKLTTPHRRHGIVAVAGLIMHLRLVSGRGGSLLAEYYTKDIKKALEAIDKLKAARFRPNIIKSSAGYVVYISTTDLLKLAEEDDAARRAVALYLAERVKNGTPRQREIAEKILRRHPLFHRSICVED
jgi:virulence-associated protein VagC